VDKEGDSEMSVPSAENEFRLDHRLPEFSSHVIHAEFVAGDNPLGMLVLTLADNEVWVYELKNKRFLEGNDSPHHPLNTLLPLTLLTLLTSSPNEASYPPPSKPLQPPFAPKSRD
jgi:hypothetical protein